MPAAFILRFIAKTIDMQKSSLIMLLLSTIAAAGIAQTRIMYISPESKTCSGAGLQQCLQFRYNTKSNWQLLYGGIQGFEFVPGYEYKLNVLETKRKNPPADASSIERKLVKVISKKAVSLDMSLLHEQTFFIKLIRLDGNIKTISNDSYWIKLSDSSLQAKVCNNISGKINIGKTGSFKSAALMSTRMACPDMSFETAFQQAIANSTRIWIGKESIQLYDKGNKLLLSATKKKGDQMQTGQPALLDYEAIIDQSSFKVMEIKDAQGATNIQDNGAFLRFNRTKKGISGKGGCNSFFGEAEVNFTNASSGKAAFSKIGSTMMACPNTMADEQRLFKLLETVTHFEFSGSILHLKAGSNTVIKLLAE